MNRIYLSPPEVTPNDTRLVVDAIDSGWAAPRGPALDAFERELASRVERKEAVALSSGTAALHLGMLGLGVRAGDTVVTSTLTFVATANAVKYLGADPVFVDVDADTWTMDSNLLEHTLETLARDGRLPRAVLTVDLYGQCADYLEIGRICARFGVPIIEDAAEALGADYRGRPAGSFGECSAFSFNGNKIITTSGGGMLVSDKRDFIERARHVATQAREPAPHYQHSELGYNYRLSNILAALGLGQLRGLDGRLRKRRAVNDFYRHALADHPGITFMPEADYGRSNCWCTCVLISPDEFGASRETVRLHLESRDIESRPVWKPMHLQPLYERCQIHGGAVAERLFERGLCLPSGTGLTTDDLERVVDGIRTTARTNVERGRVCMR